MTNISSLQIRHHLDALNTCKDMLKEGNLKGCRVLLNLMEKNLRNTKDRNCLT